VEPPEDDRPDVEAHMNLPHCVVCGRTWDDIRERWHAYPLDAAKTAFYCPACSSREFGAP